MKVLRATELGMCFGVRDALHSAQQVSTPEQVTIHGELVHNPTVIAQLELAGFHQSSEADRHQPIATPLVLITAHGISQTERRRLQQQGKRLLDTTCPLVKRAHDAAQELQTEGRHVVLIGKPQHVEVRGIVEDLESYDVVSNVEQVKQYPVDRLGIVCQTTMPSDLVQAVVEQIEQRNPQADIRLIDTVCHPTKRRQSALLELLPRVDAVVVVGGRNSNNTLRLVRMCEAHHKPVLHVEHAKQLESEWFGNMRTVGLTAGTSTLDETIDAVHLALERMTSAPSTPPAGDYP